MLRSITFRFCLFSILLIVVNSEGHPGRTDAKGGHYDRKNGGYHYHNAGASASTTPSYPSSASGAASSSSSLTICRRDARECEAVRKENEQLKYEIERLKKLLADKNTPASTTKTGFEQDNKATSSTQQILTHWMTTSSGKRHNSSCRYFKSSNGRMCGPNDGIACKICGG